jgi:two-component system phosphate regulon sensor histidine kinase PhoR
MSSLPTATTIPIGEARIAATPASFTAMGTPSCFLLVLYDPAARVGGLTNLRIPTGRDNFLGPYAVIAIQHLMTQMRGAGAGKERLIAHVVACDALSSPAFHTIEATLHSQGVRQVYPSIPKGSASRTIYFALANGQLAVQDSVPQISPPDRQEAALVFGSQLLDLHAFRAKMGKNALSLHTLLQQAAESASQMFGGALCLAGWQHDGQMDVQVSTRANANLPLRSMQGVAAWALDHGRRVQINDTQEAKWCPLEQLGVRSLLSAPLMNGAGPAGALCAIHPAPNAFETKDLQLLQLFATQTSVAIKNIQLYHQLQAKAQEMEAILQGIGDGLIVTDPTLRLVIANPVARRQLHLDGELIPGQPLPAHSPINSILRDSGESGAIKEIEITDPQNGASTTSQVMVSKMTDDEGHLRGIVAILRDITAQKEMDRMRANLLTVVSHELKTPLHSISGFVDIILMGKTGALNDLQRDFLSTVKQQSTQLQTMINDVLDFSRLEYGQFKITTEPMLLGDIVRNVLRKFELIAQEHQVNLVNRIAKELPPFKADPARLEQVLTNLVDNAIKFTPKGGQVTLSAADHGPEIEFGVSDTGVGIPPAEQAKIFERFYQVASDLGVKRRGAGLGLSICKHIVELHGGRIWVESETGQGSVFRVTLPKQMSESLGNCSVANPPQAQEKARGEALTQELYDKRLAPVC